MKPSRQLGLNRRLWASFVIGSMLVVVLIYRYATAFSGSDLAQFWAQVLVGNWAPPKSGLLGETWFAASAAIGVALNLGAFWFLVTIVQGVLYIQRKQAMSFAQALVLRDRTIKDTIYGSLFDAEQHHMSDAEQRRMIDVVEKAFKTGTDQWIKQVLPVAFSDVEREAIIKEWQSSQKAD